MCPTSKIAAMALVVLGVYLPASQQIGERSSTAAQGQFTQEQFDRRGTDPRPAPPDLRERPGRERPAPPGRRPEQDARPRR